MDVGSRNPKYSVLVFPRADREPAKAALIHASARGTSASAALPAVLIVM